MYEIPEWQDFLRWFFMNFLWIIVKDIVWLDLIIAGNINIIIMEELDGITVLGNYVHNVMRIVDHPNLMKVLEMRKMQ